MEGLHTRRSNSARPLRRGDAGVRPRTPGLAYAVLTVVVAVLIGALALTSRQAAPPTIAEFAPQAVERITDTSGGVDGTAGAGAEPTPSPEDLDASASERAQVDVARVRQCVGDPPRQIEDPQSPPCVPYWSGDNGGATARGVTRDEIRVVDPAYGLGYSETLAAFFNRRFEFYGRRIRLIRRDVPPDNAGQRAAARAAYEQDQAFASTGPDPLGQAYFDELARLGILGVHYNSLFPESYLAGLRPHLWTYTMANDGIFATAGSWYCARFAGRNAVHAGDPLVQMERRKPGVILTDADFEGTSAEPFDSRLASCGGRPEISLGRPVTTDETAFSAAYFENAMLQMKTANVTSVVCFCHLPYVGAAMRAATNQGYFPEWMITNYINNDRSFLVHVFAGTSADQLKSLMMLQARPMQRHYVDHPAYWAWQEMTDAHWSADRLDPWWVDITYWQMLLLASGVQMAGPNLTVEAFQRGLHRAAFPNPPHRIMAGAVGFEDGDHSMTDDVTEAWWSNTTQGPSTEYGTYCYVDHGARRRIGTFAADDPFFRGECDNGVR